MRRYRLFISLVGLALALGFVAVAIAGPPAPEFDCELTVNKVQSFSTGAGALRNTSTACGQTGGSSKTKTVTVVVALVDGAAGTCPSSENRLVRVEVFGRNQAGDVCPDTDFPPFDTCGADPFVFAQAFLEKTMGGGSTGRFKFNAQYSQTSCFNGEGPLAKNAGGENQLNTGAFLWDVTVTKTAADGGPSGDTSDLTTDQNFSANLLCKPCRTSS